MAWRLARRTTPDRASRTATLHFALWWSATAVNIFLGGTLYLAAGLGATSFSAQLSYTIVQRLLLAVSLYGLLNYLGFLLWGFQRRAPFAVAYGAYFLVSAYSVLAALPTTVHVGEWRTDLVYSQPTTVWTNLATLLWVVLPTVGATVAGLGVAIFNSKIESSRRRRLGTICGTLAVWWIVAVIAGQREALGFEEFQLVNRFVGLVAAFVVLTAYEPRIMGWWKDRPVPGVPSHMPSVR